MSTESTSNPTANRCKRLRKESSPPRPKRDLAIPRFDRMVVLAGALQIPLAWFVEGLDAATARPVLEFPERCLTIVLQNVE